MSVENGEKTCLTPGLNPVPKAAPENRFKISTIGVYIGLSILFYGVLAFSTACLNRDGLNPPEFSELKPVYGKLEKTSLGNHSGISITDKTTGKKYTCNDATCGYPGMEDDLNKDVKVLVAEVTFNQIYQIEVDGQIKKDYQRRVLIDKYFILKGTKYILIGMFVLAITIYFKNKNRRKN